MVYCSMASPPDRKRVTPVGNVGSLPSSLLMLNLTCFLGFFPAGAVALPWHTLLQDPWVLVCSFKSHILRHSHLLGGPNLGGLGDDDEDCLQQSGSGPAQVFSPQFVEEDLTPQSSVSNVVGTTSAPGEISCPLPKDGKIAIIEGN